LKADSGVRALVDFAALDQRDWRSIDDVVMGGRSKSRLRSSAEGTGIFEGNVSLANNGGFASVRAVVGPHDLSGCPGLRIRACGDGRQYRLRLHTEAGLDTLAYQADFDTVAGSWTECFITFKAFQPSFRGRRPQEVPQLDTRCIRQVGIMIADRQVGSFRLEIAWIRPDNPPASATLT
jgi:hypothetical protein